MTSTSDTNNKVITREDNPKAVFFGTHENIITPLAVYLNSQNVDLFAAKELSDAFFGNYFFYVGDINLVKTFIETHAKELPKSLIFLSANSELNKLEQTIKAHTQIKLVLVDLEKALTETDVRQVFEFFFTSSSQVLELWTAPLIKKTPVNQDQPYSELDQQVPHNGDGHLFTVSAAEHDESPEIASQSVHTVTHVDDATVTPTDEIHRGVNELYAQHEQKLVSSKKKSISKLFAGSLVTLTVFVLFPILLVMGEFGLGVLALSQAEKYYDKGNIAATTQALDGAKTLFGWSKNHLDAARPVFSLLTLQQTHTQWVQLSETGLKLSKGIGHLMDVQQEGKLLVQGVLQKDETISFGQLVSSIKGSLTLADADLAFVEAQMKTPSLSSLISSRWFPGKGQLVEQVSTVRKKIEISRNAISLLPELTGFYGKRSFVIVLQNNMELRPTGGFIGSYALVEFEDGHLQNVKIDDVYTADGALEGHVDPPPAIMTHLGQEHWYLRDSNWDPDFSESGARIAWFIDKELDVQVDGVIAVDLELMKSVLGVIGPLEISDFQVTVTADNLFSLAHEQIESNFFPGSTHKKDFLSSLGNRLLERMTLEKELPHAKIANTLYEGINQKHLQVYMVNPTLQRTIEVFGWAGVHELSHNCISVNCVPDYQMVVDANLGSNKANYYVERKIHDTVTFENERLMHELDIRYKNTSPTETRVGGAYKNYLRVFVPKDAQLSKASIAGTDLLLGGDNVASISSAIVSHQGELNVFEVLVEVAPQKEITASFTYETPLLSSGQSHFDYVYHVQKQPGTKNDPYELTVQYPRGWGVAGDVKSTSDVAGAAILVNQGSIAYNSSLWHDQVIKLSLTK